MEIPCCTFLTMYTLFIAAVLACVSMATTMCLSLVQSRSPIDPCPPPYPHPHPVDGAAHHEQQPRASTPLLEVDDGISEEENQSVWNAVANHIPGELALLYKSSVVLNLVILLLENNIDEVNLDNLLVWN